MADPLHPIVNLLREQGRLDDLQVEEIVQENAKTGKPVPDAVIFATRLDMAPDAMQEMATKVTPVPGAEPGTYKFKATFGMAGRWQLSLGAKVQGETGTVENKLVITAQK